MAYGTQQYGDSQYGTEDALTFLRTFSETVGTNEARIFDIQTTKSETVGLTPVYSRDMSYLRTYTETSGITDSFSRTGTFYRSYNDVLGANDVYNGSASLYRTILEDFSVDDVLQPFNISLVRSEELGVNESYSRVADFLRSFSETASFNESSSLRPELFLYESAGFADSVAIQYIIFRNYVETTGFNDVLASKAIQKLLSEVSGFNESYTRTGSFFKALQEDVSVSETYSSTADLYRLYDEDVGLTPVYSRSMDYFRTFEDVLALQSVYIRAVDLFRAHSEVMSFDETYSSAAHRFRAFTEQIDLTDTRTFGVRKLLSEEFSLNESYSALVSYRRTFDEGLGLNDRRKYFLLSEVVGPELEDDGDLFEKIDIDIELSG